jgi:hypothetical protein
MTGSLSDRELATFDINAMLRPGLAGDNDVARRNLFSTGAVGAAVNLDRAQTIPDRSPITRATADDPANRNLSFLAHSGRKHRSLRRDRRPVRTMA